jgi:Outer membrane lipoprotein-sorting protein
MSSNEVITMPRSISTLLGFLLIVTAGAPARAENLSARQILDRVLDADPFGLSGAIVEARALLKDKNGSSSQLSFQARSRRHDPPYAKSLVRFTAPPDLAGAGFLQVQNRGSDDDRYLFLPELKRSRKISGDLRGSSFMGTDFSYADFDRRDLREATLTMKPDEQVGKFSCYVVEVVPRRSDSPYSKLTTWIRKDNYLPLKITMDDRAGVLVKTLTALEIRRISDQWYITRARMVDHGRSHTTELYLDRVVPQSDVPDDEFTVRSLEKL